MKTNQLSKRIFKKAHHFTSQIVTDRELGRNNVTGTYKEIFAQVLTIVWGNYNSFKHLGKRQVSAKKSYIESGPIFKHFYFDILFNAWAVRTQQYFYTMQFEGAENIEVTEGYEFDGYFDMPPIFQQITGHKQIRVKAKETTPGKWAYRRFCYTSFAPLS